MAHSKDLEFGGALGAIAMVVGLPLGVLFLNLACNKDSCTPFGLPPLPSSLSDLYDSTAVMIYLGWFSFQLVLYILPTGSVVEGLPLKNGKKLKYRCNAFINMMISLVAFGALYYMGVPVHIVYHKFIPLAAAAIGFSFLLSLFLYVKAKMAPEEQLASGGNSGIFIYDFFIGHELNPRVGPVDLKFFCELRPGLIGWVMLDLCFLAEATRQFGSPPPALLLVTFFHAFYVADALWFEECILSTMDIVHDGFGFMLAFGDLAWVPFLYGLQARFLLEHPQQWSSLALLAILVMDLVGYAIFRGSNSQKNAFRKDPNHPSVSHLLTIPTASGRKLLISGWWGLCRHPNYLGDLIMALSWSLPCGWSHIIPYFYPIYFLGLLVHRFARDDVNCRNKYGADWDKYCSKVNYKIFPYIY